MSRYPFAPGVIDSGSPTSHARRAEAAGRAALVLVGVVCFCAVAGFCVGYFNLPGFL